MRSYPCSVVGLRYEGRASYVERNIASGTLLSLKREPDNPYDPKAVAVFHGARKIGFIPAEKAWVCRSIDEGDRHNVRVDDLIYGEDGELSSLFITITIIEDGREGASDPMPNPNPVIAAIGDELRILSAIAKVGGRFEKSESTLIASYAKIRAGELGIAVSDDNVAQAVKWLRRHIPDRFEVAQLIGRIERPSAIEALDEVCELVAQADGKITTEETDAIADLRSLLVHRRSIGFS